MALPGNPMFWGCCAEGGWKPGEMLRQEELGKVQGLKWIAEAVEEHILAQEMGRRFKGRSKALSVIHHQKCLFCGMRRTHNQL